MNKSQRKALARGRAKLGYVPLKQLTPEEIREQREARPYWATRIFVNNHFTVMINDNAITSQCIAKLAYIVPFHAGREVFWKDLQRIKNEIFGEEAMAIQYFPPESSLIDEANVYWLFVFPEGIIPVYVPEK